MEHGGGRFARVRIPDSAIDVFDPRRAYTPGRVGRGQNGSAKWFPARSESFRVVSEWDRVEAQGVTMDDSDARDRRRAGSVVVSTQGVDIY